MDDESYDDVDSGNLRSKSHPMVDNLAGKYGLTDGHSGEDSDDFGSMDYDLLARVERVRQQQRLAHAAQQRQILAEQIKLEKDFLRRIFGRTRKPTLTQEGYYELEVDDFNIFESENPKRSASLHELASSKPKASLNYSLSGVIRHENGMTQRVEELQITGVYIRNFGRLDGDNRPALSSCRNAIYLETRLSESHDCRYLLRSPSPIYEEKFATFTWLATLTKHVHDYVQWSIRSDQTVSLEDFRECFHKKLLEWHHDDPHFLEWSQQCPGATDFRHKITCGLHAKFIFDQICKIKQSDNEVLQSQPLWTEVAPQKLRDPTKEKNHLNRRTPVTAWIKEVFLKAFPEWRRRRGRGEDLLVAMDLAPDVLKKRDTRSELIGLGNKLSHRRSDHFSDQNISVAAQLLEQASESDKHPSSRSSIAELPGKAVILRMSTKYGTEYKYAYVLRVNTGGSEISVRWLVLPNRTVCEGRTAGRSQTRPKTFYPIGNELFWSDECCCEAVRVSRMVAVHGISILQDHAQTENELFVHRQYVSEDDAICEISSNELESCMKHGERQSKSRERPLSSCIKFKTDTVGRILSLFSGAGFLDRGIETGAQGLFETIFAADYNLAALTSYKLNHPNPGRCEFHNMDVTVLWEEIAQGKRPLQDIVILVSGCPCQGFTGLNNNKDEDEARKNCSMLAQTLAWVDTYRPLMVVVENVTRMDPIGTTGSAKTASAAGQAVSVLVAMGYQARLVTIRDSDYGGATIRERLFILATVPGISLPWIPPPTHGPRKDQSVVLTASAVTQDLVKIHNNTSINPHQPDHVPFQNLKDVLYSIVTKMPTVSSEYRSNLYAARSQLETVEEIAWFGNLQESRKSASSHSYCRMRSDTPMHTIVTSFNLACNRTGTLLHWLEHRACSLLELRRGHGVPDYYILVGDKSQQLHHVGNSVAWITSNLLGRALAEV